tara:strand:- start:264 stop:530 length:267 start_codon:yes stop_codon:yes gene_type:complete
MPDWVEIVVIQTKSFGKIDKFEIGDLVSWTTLANRERLFGIISDLAFESTGGRKVAKARIFCNKKGLIRDILTLNLQIVSKARLITSA